MNESDAVVGIQKHKRLKFVLLSSFAFILFGTSTFLSLSTLHIVFLVFADIVIQDIRNCFLSLFSWEVLLGETAQL